MTKEQEKQIEDAMKNALKEARFQGLKAGATGILGAILNMCKEGKTTEDIKNFCESSLAMEGMKYKK